MDVFKFTEDQRTALKLIGGNGQEGIGALSTA